MKVYKVGANGRERRTISCARPMIGITGSVYLFRSGILSLSVLPYSYALPTAAVASAMMFVT